MIEVIEQSSRYGKRKKEQHPEWESWMQASAYTPEVARRELGIPNSTFYRRIAKPPTHIDRLAMRALYEGLEPFTAESEDHPNNLQRVRA